MGRTHHANNQQLNRLRPPSVNLQLPNDEQEIIADIEACLSPDLLSPKYLPYVKSGDPVTRGHCYVAAEAAFFLFGKERGYQPQTVRCNDGGTHWWLKHPTDGRIADPTESQTDGKFDYSVGRGSGFVPPGGSPNAPSRRAKVLMERVLARRRERGAS